MRMREVINLAEKWRSIPEDARACISPQAVPKRSDLRDLGPEAANAVRSFLQDVALITYDKWLFDDVSRLLCWINGQVHNDFKDAEDE